MLQGTRQAACLPCTEPGVCIKLTGVTGRSVCPACGILLHLLLAFRLRGSMLNLMEACMANGSYWCGRLLGLLVAMSKECCRAFPVKALQLQLSSGDRLLWPASENFVLVKTSANSSAICPKSLHGRHEKTIKVQPRN